MTCLCLLAGVTQMMAQEVVYEHVKYTTQLATGEQYIFVCSPKKKAMGYQKASKNRKAVNIPSINGNYITDISIATKQDETDKVYEFTLEGEVDAWRFYDNVYKGYLYATGNASGQNYLETGIPSRNSHRNVSISKGEKGTTFKFAPKETSNNYKVTHNILSIYGDCFSCYNTAYESISLYRKVKVLGSLSISKFGSTTYSSTIYKYEMPHGCVGYAITCEEGHLKLTEKYKEGDAVPANTPLLIQGNEGTYHLYETTRTATKLQPEENLLHSDFDDEGNITYDIENASSNYYYKLTTKGGQNLGFYWGAEEGAPFKMKSAERAYLVLPRQQSNVKGLVLDEAQIETAIAQVKQTSQPTGKVYDLSGRPCQGRLMPGIYIQDGKKIIVRK